MEGEPDLRSAIAEASETTELAVRERWATSTFNRISDIFRLRDESGELVRFKPYPYTVKFINDMYDWPDTDQHVLKSRQLGLSTAFELAAPDIAMSYDNIEVSIIAQKHETAKKALRKCGMFMKDSPYFPLLPIQIRNIQKEMIEFDNGSRIVAYPATPDSVRSDNIKKAFLDEFAFVKDQAGMKAAIEPKVTRGGSIAYVSTPLSGDDEFMRGFRAAQAGNGALWYYLPMYLKDSIDLTRPLTDQPGVPRLCFDAKLDRLESIRLDSIERFMQEYMCIPLDDSMAYYPTPLIMSATMENLLADAIRDEARNIKSRSGRVLFGIDHAMVHDETAIVVVYELYGAFYIVDFVTTRGDIDQQLILIDDLVRTYLPSKITIDGTNEMGIHLTTKLTDAYGWIVEGVPYTNTVKKAMAVSLKRYLQNSAKKIAPYVKIPIDQDIISQLHGIKAEATQAGNIRFSGKGGGALDDIVNAIWLALPNVEPDPEGGAVSVNDAAYEERLMRQNPMPGPVGGTFRPMIPNGRGLPMADVNVVAARRQRIPRGSRGGNIRRR